MNLAKELRELATSVCKNRNDIYNKEFDDAINKLKEKAEDGKFETVIFTSNEAVGEFLYDKIVEEGFSVLRRDVNLLYVRW